MSKTYSNNGKPNRLKTQSPENFLEALRDLGRSATQEVTSQAKAALTQDVPESFGISPSGTLQPNESFTLTDLNQAEQSAYHRAEYDFSSRLAEIRRAEHDRLLQEESAAKKQVQAIREEISKLAKSMGDLAQEIQIATMQTPSNPGIYHQNFYTHLRSIIKALRTRVESSRNWLAASNARASKRGFYWSQVGKSGSKYMLSSERYMVTSTG
jgi:hypothetical protein